MKIRTSFVTNSSSSSFICMFAEVIDEELFKASSLGECYFGWQFKSRVKDWTVPGFYDFGADWAGVWIDKSKIEDDKKYFYWEEYGGAGDDDYDFWDESYGEMDYDISLDDFPENQQEIFSSAVPENGLKEIDRGYGAGRNG